jgi:hypothetical protein
MSNAVEPAAFKVSVAASSEAIGCSLDLYALAPYLEISKERVKKISKIVKDEDGNVYNMTEGEYLRQAPASIWWFLFPMFLGFIGGIIMYAVLRKRDRHTANFGFIIGIVMAFVWFLFFTLIGLLYVPTVQQQAV